MPPTAIAVTWAADEAHASMTSVETTPMEARSRSGHSVLAIPSTAWATIATAAMRRPWRTPAPVEPELASRTAPLAKAISATADGSVNPIHAASAPEYPARFRPSANATWLLAGPGRN